MRTVETVKIILQNGAVIGYVPEEDATVMAPLLDAGHKQKAWVKKIPEGRRAPFPVIVANCTRVVARCQMRFL